jgi:hypothetical protein
VVEGAASPGHQRPVLELEEAASRGHRRQVGNRSRSARKRDLVPAESLGVRKPADVRNGEETMKSERRARPRQ